MTAGFISRSSSIGIDPLSDVLSLLKPHAYKAVGLDAGEDWSLRLHRTDGFLCLAVASGSCWLVVDDVVEPVRLKAGDIAVLPKAPSFRVASDPAVPYVDFASAITGSLEGTCITWQGGGACLLLSAFFTFTNEHSSLLSDVLPPVLHLENSEESSGLQAYVERLMSTIRDPQPGNILMGEYLAQMLLLEVLQLQITRRQVCPTGWLSALANRQTSAAITAMHERPGHRWTVQELAKRAGMSRSAFAEKFKQQTGVAVMEYLVRWRMMLAADRLVHSTEAVTRIALALGYKSESAFSFAFKREMGCSPRQYVRSFDPRSLAIHTRSRVKPLLRKVCR